MKRPSALRARLLAEVTRLDLEREADLSGETASTLARVAADVERTNPPSAASLRRVAQHLRVRALELRARAGGVSLP